MKKVISGFVQSRKFKRGTTKVLDTIRDSDKD